MMDIVLGFGLVAVTALMTFFIYRTLHNQYNTNSAILVEDFFMKLKKNQKVWNKMTYNYEHKDRPLNELLGYKKDEIYEMLDTLERISVLVRTRVITLEYTYEMFSTLFFSCLKNNDKQIMMIYKNEPRFFSNVKIVSKWCHNYYKNDKWFKFRYHYFWYRL